MISIHGHCIPKYSEFQQFRSLVEMSFDSNLFRQTNWRRWAFLITVNLWPLTTVTTFEIFCRQHSTIPVTKRNVQNIFTCIQNCFCVKLSFIFVTRSSAGNKTFYTILRYRRIIFCLEILEIMNILDKREFSFSSFEWGLVKNIIQFFQ